ncbi:hypothetical protein B0H14DRAFT_2583748 [Mycena olivaceomarginata]|nr:hypothetical protein B0H14DRAFT_2583748 [Mycena olivaceomarginata]
MYPWDAGCREMSLIMFPPEAVTLRNPDILDNNFFASPAQCTICPKPHLSHQAIPGASFTIIVSCPHHTNVAQSPPRPNCAVANLLPDQRRHETCNGNLMVFKHAISNNPAVSNQDLPVVDILPADFLHVDELNQIKSDLDKTPGYLQEGLTRCYSISMVTLDPPLPLYDLDEIIASLTLDDPPTSRTPPPSYRSHLPPSSPASSPPWTPHMPSRNAPSTATTYTYCSPGKSGVSNAWSEAGHATQGVLHSSVRAVAKSNPRRPKSKAYVVFRGLHVGVFEKWDDVMNATSGASCTLQQGYASRAAAQAVYALAQANDWTCVLPTTRSSFAAPTGLTREPRDSELLCPRERNDRWLLSMTARVVTRRRDSSLLMRCTAARTPPSSHRLKIWSTHMGIWRTHHENLAHSLRTFGESCIGPSHSQTNPLSLEIFIWHT